MSELAVFPRRNTQRMTTEEAAKLITAIADSLDRDPDQFNFRLMIVGAMGTAQGGGTGISGVAVGGGTGFSASASSGDVHIERGEGAKREAVAQTTAILRELAAATSEKDKGKVRVALGRLQQAAIAPAMLLDTVSNVLDISGVL
ncbi:MAG: hypothetical protein ACRDJN_02245 [Chloroflexota bacterium]